MNPSFIKLLRSDEVLHLARRHPKAFILLTFIAHRARWENGLPDGLTIGQCRIGDWENMGLTRQEYRTALDILIGRNHIEIVETCRTRKKSTTGSTTIGTLVKLISSNTYIIENESPNHQINHRATTEQPPSNHELERNRNTSSNEEVKYARSPKAPRTKDDLSFDFENWQFIGITDKDKTEWLAIYTHINLEAEIGKAAQWLKSNPSKSKKSLWRKYLTGWLQRANDWSENKKAFSYASGNTTDRRTKDINGVPVENAYAGMF